MSGIKAIAVGVTAACVLLLTAPPLHAAEQVTLKNGFQMLCDHSQMVGSHVRLYTDSGDQDYLEIGSNEIQTMVAVPDVPIPRQEETDSSRARLSGAEMHELMAEAGAEHNLDVDLLASVVRAESAGNPRAVSRAGAEGLMQLMPATAAELGVSDSFRPAQNIDAGTAYLDSLLTRYHDDLALALAAYNAGPAAVDRYHGVPPYAETRAYVARVIREFNRRKRAEIAAAHAGLQR